MIVNVVLSVLMFVVFTLVGCTLKWVDDMFISKVVEGVDNFYPFTLILI